MISTVINSLLIEKPFYLLRPQSFSFRIVSEFIDIFVKFSNIMSRCGAFDFLFPFLFRREGFFLLNDCPRCLLRVVSKGFVSGGGGGGLGLVLDETDNCITGGSWIRKKSIFLTHRIPKGGPADPPPSKGFSK